MSVHNTLGNEVLEKDGRLIKYKIRLNPIALEKFGIHKKRFCFTLNQNFLDISSHNSLLDQWIQPNLFFGWWFNSTSIGNCKKIQIRLSSLYIHKHWKMADWPYLIDSSVKLDHCCIILSSKSCKLTISRTYNVAGITMFLSRYI